MMVDVNIASVKSLFIWTDNLTLSPTSLKRRTWIQVLEKIIVGETLNINNLLKVNLL